MTSFSVQAVVLHSVAASVMTWGFLNLKNLPADRWIRMQKGGHFQYLTILGLCLALLTVILSLGTDLLPSLTILRKVKRCLFMVALPVAIVVASVYWSLLLLAPQLILQVIPPEFVSIRSEPEPTNPQPELAWNPLSIDLALHAVPVLSLIVDFYWLETRYSRNEAIYGGITTAVLAAIAYGCWAEWLATYNGFFAYPFLTENTPTIRKCIYAGLDTIAILIFWMMNALHP